MCEIVSHVSIIVQTQHWWIHKLEKFTLNGKKQCLPLPPCAPSLHWETTNFLHGFLETRGGSTKPQTHLTLLPPVPRNSHTDHIGGCSINSTCFLHEQKSRSELWRSSKVLKLISGVSVSCIFFHSWSHFMASHDISEHFLMTSTVYFLVVLFYWPLEPNVLLTKSVSVEEET